MQRLTREKSLTPRSTLSVANIAIYFVITKSGSNSVLVATQNVHFSPGYGVMIRCCEGDELWHISPLLFVWNILREGGEETT